jgi:drug/metabolite transporter (DMT)-like permease
MLATSLLLLLVAAVLHAITNVLIKNARDKLAFGWWMLGFFCVPGIPLLFFLHQTDSTGWMFVIASGLLEAIYFFTLSRAYTLGDLSVVYPVARGSAPLFVLLWAALFLHERPSKWGIVGIALVVMGLYLIHLPSLKEWKKPLAGFRFPAVRWALYTGLLISGYTALDKKGVTYFSPWIYLYLLLSICWIALSLQWLIPNRRTALIAEIGFDRRMLQIAAAAILGAAGYATVLTAMRLTPVSYVSPVREISVVIGTWIGIRFLGERGGTLRIAAASLVAAGVLLIAIGG